MTLRDVDLKHSTSLGEINKKAYYIYKTQIHTRILISYQVININNNEQDIRYYNTYIIYRNYKKD